MLLHSKLGVNPRLTVCPRCGGDTNEIVLLGNYNSIKECVGCGARVVGPTKECACGCRNYRVVRELDAHEKLTSSSLCDACAAELKEHEAIVADGGIYFKCDQCGSSGVIRGSAQLAQALRRKTGKAAPEPIGVRFETCEQHAVR